MGKLLFIRHAAVQIDPAVPAHKWPLSAEGRAHSRAIAPQLAAHEPTIIITSVERKARETGQLVAEALGIPWQTAANLHEHDRHGALYLDNKETFEATIADLFARPNELVYGRETAAQAQTRFETAVRDVLSAYPVGNVAIVAHGTVITLFLAQHNPRLDAFTFWRKLTLPCFFVVSLPDLILLDPVYT